MEMDNLDPFQETVRKKWFLAFVAFFVVVIVISVLAYLRAIPVDDVRGIPYYDKIGHIVIYGLASYLGYRASGRRHLTYFGIRVPSVPLLVLLLGLAEEIGLQAISPYRDFSILDLSANLSGIVFFYLADRIWLAQSDRGGLT